MVGQAVLDHGKYVQWRVREVLKPVRAPVHCEVCVGSVCEVCVWGVCVCVCVCEVCVCGVCVCVRCVWECVCV